jgi:hypothetical protein
MADPEEPALTQSVNDEHVQPDKDTPQNFQEIQQDQQVVHNGSSKAASPPATPSTKSKEVASSDVPDTSTSATSLTPELTTKFIAAQEKAYKKNIDSWSDEKYNAARAAVKQAAIDAGAYVPTSLEFGIFVVPFPRDKPGPVAGYLRLRDVWETRNILLHSDVEGHMNRAAKLIYVRPNASSPLGPRSCQR